MEDSNKSQEIRNFSKENYPEKRQEIATEIKEKRAEYFDRKDATSAEIKDKEDVLGERKKRVEGVISVISELESYTEERKGNILSRILHFRDLKKAREEIGRSQVDLGELNEEIDLISSSMDELEEQKQDRRELGEAKAILESFWQGQSEALEENKENERDSNIKNVMKKHGCAIMHGILPDGIPIPKGNSLLRGDDVSWKEKLAVLLALEPSISCSSIKSGESVSNLWSRIGVIVADGKIIDASPGDMATVSDSVKNREISATAIRDKERIGKKIERAIEGDADVGHNELVVENPEFSAFYIWLEDDPGKNEQSESVFNSLEEIYSYLKDLGLPIFGVAKGDFYELEYTQNSRQGLSWGEKVDIGAITDQSFDVNGLRENMIQQIIEGKVFNEGKFAFLEVKKFRAYFGGRGFYAGLLGLEMARRGECDDTDYYTMVNSAIIRTKNGNQLDEDKLAGVPFYDEVKHDGEVDKFFVSKSEYADSHDVCCLTFNGKFYDVRLVTDREIMDDVEKPQNVLGIRHSATTSGLFFENQYLNSVEDYLSNVPELLENLFQKFTKLRDNHGEEHDWTIDLKNRFMTGLFEVYGFALEAQENGDQDTFNRALEILEKYISREELEGFVKDRINENGDFVLTREDIIK